METLATTIYTIAMFRNLCFSESPLTGRVQAAAFFLIYVGALWTGWNFKVDNSLVQIINTFIKFETDFLKGMVSHS